VTVRVYTWVGSRESDSAYADRDQAFLDAYVKWGISEVWVFSGFDERGWYAVWLEFETEAEAALFKLREM
jgi:hypothetical protein